jgi:hypothetical protein
MSTEIKHLEFELEKARNGMAMPYDRERVLALEAQLREARQRVRMRKGAADGGQAPAEATQVARGATIFATQLPGTARNVAASRHPSRAVVLYSIRRPAARAGRREANAAERLAA